MPGGNRLACAVLALLICTSVCLGATSGSVDQQADGYIDLAGAIEEALALNTSVVYLGAPGYVLGGSITFLSLPEGKDVYVAGNAATIYVQASAAGGLRLGSGARLKLVNCTIVVPPAASGLSAADTDVLAPLRWLMSNTTLGGTFHLEQVRVVLDSCDELQSLQASVCSHLQTNMQASWTTPLVGRGFVGLPALGSSSLTTSNVMLTCGQWAESASTALNQSDLDLIPPGLNGSIATGSVSGLQQLYSLPCAVARVTTPQALSAAIVALQLQVAPQAPVVLQLTGNMSLGSDTWPVGGVRISTNVTLVGPPAAQGSVIDNGTLDMIELDLRLNLDWVTVDQHNGTLLLQDLVLSNLPVNDDCNFPTSLLVGAVWPVKFDRPHATRTMLVMQRVLIVVPADLFDYLSYWGGLQTSNIPLVREKAAWLQGNVYFAQQIGDADDDHLLFTRREGQGTVWLNSALTKKVYAAPQMLAKTGVLDLTLDPYTPFPSITPIFNASQLVTALISPNSSYLMLMRDILLDAAAIQSAQPSTSMSDTKQPSTAACIAGVNVTVTQPVTVIGRPGSGTIALDFGNCAASVVLRLAQGARLVLQRLLLTGLGPAAPNMQLSPPALANVSSRLWALNTSASQVAVRLQNVSLLVSGAEIRALGDMLGLQQPASPSSSTQRPGSATAALRPSLITQLRPAFGVMDVMTYTNDSLVLNNVAYNGIEGSQVVLTSTIPDPLAHANLTAVADLVLSEREEPQETAGLVAWQKAIIGVFSALGGLMLLAAAGYLAAKVLHMRRDLAAANEVVKTVAALGSNHVHIPIGDDALSNLHHSHSRSSRLSAPSPATTHAGQEHPSGAQGLLTSKMRTSKSNGNANHEVAAYISSRSTAPSHAAHEHHSSTGSGKSRKLEGGLAPADDSVTPNEQLARLIETQRDTTGIDMQQVEIEQVVGQGSFGVVYRGKWRSMTVAVKALMFQDAGAAKRVKQRAITEAAINTLLTHENIVNTYAYDLRPVDASGLPDDKMAAHWKLYIIQEFCDGGSLAQAIDKGTFVDTHTGQRNMAHIIQVAADIAKGMQYIHERSVIHGDLSSGNIMLRFDSRTTSCFRAKVCDFGLSRFLDSPEQSHISNARQGTPGYIAPEVMSSGIMSKDADSWSYGVLLWELWHGRPPWRDTTIPRGTYDPNKFRHLLPPACPPSYQALVYACLYPHPKARPRFGDIINKLAELAAEVKQEAAARVWAQLPTGALQTDGDAVDSGLDGYMVPPPVELAKASSAVLAPAVHAAEAGSGRARAPPLAHQQLQLAQALACTQPAIQLGHGLSNIQPIAAAAAAAKVVAADSRLPPAHPLVEGMLPPGGHTTWATSLAGMAGSFSITESTSDFVPAYDPSLKLGPLCEQEQASGAAAAGPQATQAEA